MTLYGARKFYSRRQTRTSVRMDSNRNIRVNEEWSFVTHARTQTATCAHEPYSSPLCPCCMTCFTRVHQKNSKRQINGNSMAARLIFRLAAGLFGVSVLQCTLQNCGLDLPSRAIDDHVDDNAGLRKIWDSPRLQHIAVDPRMKTTMKLAVHENINRSGTVPNPSQT